MITNHFVGAILRERNPSWAQFRVDVISSGRNSMRAQSCVGGIPWVESCVGGIPRPPIQLNNSNEENQQIYSVTTVNSISAQHKYVEVYLISIPIGPLRY